MRSMRAGKDGVTPGFTHEPGGSLTEDLAGLSPETAVAEQADAVGAKWQPETTIT